MNGNSVVGKLYKIKGGQEVSLNNSSLEVEIEKRVFNVHYVMKTNSNYVNGRRYIEVDWEASFELQGYKAAWKKMITDLKKKELYSLKKSIGFNTKEDYAEAVEMGEETTMGGRDYIIKVEQELEVIKDLKAPAKKAAPKKAAVKKTATPPTLGDIMEEEGDND